MILKHCLKALFLEKYDHWQGMGIIVLAIAILPMLGIGGMQLFSAEAPGSGISDKFILEL